MGSTGLDAGGVSVSHLPSTSSLVKWMGGGKRYIMGRKLGWDYLGFY